MLSGLHVNLEGFFFVLPSTAKCSIGSCNRLGYRLGEGRCPYKNNSYLWVQECQLTVNTAPYLEFLGYATFGIPDMCHCWYSVGGGLNLTTPRSQVGRKYHIYGSQPLIWFGSTDTYCCARHATCMCDASGLRSHRCLCLFTQTLLLAVRQLRIVHNERAQN